MAMETMKSHKVIATAGSAAEAEEDRRDIVDARKVLADMKVNGEKPIPLAKFKKRLGL